MNYGMDIMINLYYKYTGVDSLDRIGRDTATTVTAANTGEDVHDYHPH